MKDKKLLTSLMKCHDTELGEGAKNDIGVRVMYMFNVARATQNEQRVEDHSWVRKLIDLRLTASFQVSLSFFIPTESPGSHREAIYSSFVGKYDESRLRWSAISTSHFDAKRVSIVWSFQSKHDLCIHIVNRDQI
jgi:hypothetical protein